jgi:hypothetical protein
MASTPAAVLSSLSEGAPYTIKEQSVPTVVLPPPPPSLPPASDGADASSLAYIEAASHEARIRRAAAERDDKGTGVAYARHVQNYSTWWDGYQARRLEADSSWSQIPAFPITAAKAALFLDHEVSRMKVLIPSLFPPAFLTTPTAQPSHPGTYPRLSCWPLSDTAGHQCTGRLEEEPPPPAQGC